MNTYQFDKHFSAFINVCSASLNNLRCIASSRDKYPWASLLVDCNRLYKDSKTVSMTFHVGAKWPAGLHPRWAWLFTSLTWQEILCCRNPVLVTFILSDLYYSCQKSMQVVMKFTVPERILLAMKHLFSTIFLYLYQITTIHSPTRINLRSMNHLAHSSCAKENQMN